MHNPFSDVARFLVGASPDYNPLGASRYVFVVFYIALMAGVGRDRAGATGKPIRRSEIPDMSGSG